MLHGVQCELLMQVKVRRLTAIDSRRATASGIGGSQGARYDEAAGGRRDGISVEKRLALVYLSLNSSDNPTPCPSSFAKVAISLGTKLHNRPVHAALARRCRGLLT